MVLSSRSVLNSKLVFIKQKSGGYSTKVTEQGIESDFILKKSQNSDFDA